MTVQYPTAGTKLGQITVTDSLNNTVGPIACQSVTVTSGPQTLATEVSARRNNLDFWHTLQLTGGAPMNDVDLSSTISGSAAGTVNFTFFCNKNTPDTDTSEPRDAKFDGVDITQAYGPGPANAAPPGVIGNYFTFGNLNIEIWPAEKRFAVNDVCDYPTAGTYYPKVVAERQALAAEDRLSAGVVVSGDYVDLIIDSHNSAPPNPIPGQLMSFTGVVKNQGTIGAGASTARLRIDLNNNGWSPGEPEFTAPTGALAPNGGSETESWTNIWAAVLGTHRYQICADSTDVVVESNNANNCNGATTGVFIVAPKPQCSDSIDNDGDGKIDYPADPGCVSPEDNNELDNPDFQEVEP
ncbi:MAG: hypothetical protein HYT40_01730 [Candidatus Sungbacteria bacterium]|uniref:CARDB domain-containing protein n=1 Tax=Candidatus Sungiibacteriota bacterium TaxID=2750080 RepID=A0A931SCJ6_9BACT|nr:hypothetical protein [Candidatus Sungbacteria bacterium]